MHLWVSEPLGCSGRVVIAVVDDDQGLLVPASALTNPHSVAVIDQATAELAVEMLHDATARAGDHDTPIDLDTIIERATHAIGRGLD